MKSMPVITHTCTIRNNRMWLDGKLVFVGQEGPPAAFLTETYRHLGISYPKFFKMDNLCRLGFLAAETVLHEAGVQERYGSDAVGLLLSNAASSIDTDRNHQASIANRDDYFPSPSVFVYTLANIVIGEICIRHKLTGESSFFIEPVFSAAKLHDYLSLLFENDLTRCALAGRVEMDGPNYEAFLCFIEKEAPETTGIANFEIEEIHKLYQQTN